MLRAIVLPVILFVDRFPRDVTAPREVRPDLAEARTTSRADAETRLERAAAAAARTLRDAPADATLRHAYFGALTPYQAIRMLSAHTRHHARLLRSAASRG